MEQLLNRRVGGEVEMLAGDSEGLADSKVPASHGVLLTSAAGMCLPCNTWPSLEESWVSRPLFA